VTRADWEAATPKCPRDGEPLVYDAEHNMWRCGVHAIERSGELLAREAGFVGMWWSGVAA
jgi:hypothetical protein